MFLPFAAPSTGAFTGQIGRIADLHAQHPQGEEQGLFRVNSPVRGAAGKPHVDEGTGSSFRQPPVKATNLPGANLNSQRLARRVKTRNGFHSNAGKKRQSGRLLTRTFLVLALRAPLASQSASSELVFGDFLFNCMDAGGRAPTVGALGDAGAVAEAMQKKVTRLRVREPDLNNYCVNHILEIKIR